MDVRRSAGLAAIVSVVALSGCATTPNNADPWERTNRAIYKFNDAVDRAALKPVAKSYKKITPNWFRKGVDNFFTNLEQPVVLVNELLQGKPGSALTTTGRLIVNTIFGLGGIFDPASGSNIPLGDEDFGQTLGRWGVPSGPFLMLPFLGPSSVRDGPARVADYYLGPLHYADLKTVEEWGLRGLEFVDQRARLLSADETIRNAYDPYAFIRNAWLQRRAYEVSDGAMPEDDEEAMDLEEETGDAPPTPPTSSSPDSPPAPDAR